MNELLFLGLIALVAFAYAMVGHGGASGYLALMALVGIPLAVAQASALMINLVVSAIAFAQYARAGYFRWPLFWPFALASVPMAWLGKQIDLDETIYERILAICLLLVVMRLLDFFGTNDKAERQVPLAAALGIGAVPGFVAGLISIGGGILLSPILLLMRWADTKVTACTSALFILVNSAAGLVGTRDLAAVIDVHLFSWVAVALGAGLVGAYIGARRLQPPRLRQALGVVLLFACIKLWWP